MIKYIPESQLSIEEFKTPFETSLSADNRWVELSKIVPWDYFASIYIELMSSNIGRPGLSPRIILGALIIKHKEKLDDRGVILAIQENIYMQYFVGLKGFSVEPIFDASLFVEIRKRIGATTFDQLNLDLIKSASQETDQKHLSKKSKDKKDGDESCPSNKGKLQMDATVADQYITFPTDSKLLNSGRKQSEKMIDHLYKISEIKGIKPRTYRRMLDKSFLNYSKKRNQSKASHRKMNRKLLEALKRNLKHINNFLGQFEKQGMPFPFRGKKQKMLWVLHTFYKQQQEMYDQKSNSCKDRIVSIFQPHVRAIPRGKARARVEFGSKLGVSLDQGFARVNTFSWDAYHEASDLILQVEAYQALHGYYPELVQVDKLYATRANRKWLKEREIRITAPALGRKSKEQLNESYYKKRKRKIEAAERNHIEAKFGQGKNGYNLNKIRATLKETSESWVAAIFFVMNLINYHKVMPSRPFFLITNLIKSIKWPKQLLSECKTPRETLFFFRPQIFLRNFGN